MEDGLSSHGDLSPDPDSNPEHLPPPENKRFYPALDGLRAIAVLMVFFGHYGALRFPFLLWGSAGVDLFFVLSGFLITGILYDTRNDPHRVRNFYMRRTLRIFPLYYGVLLGALLTTPLFHWLWSPAWVLWFCYLGNYARFVFIHSPLLHVGALDHLWSQPRTATSLTLYLGHFWSLCVEEQFYLLWPLVVFTVRKRETLRTICLASIPVVLAARTACLWLVPPLYLSQEIVYRATPLRADALLIGGFLALALRGPEADRLLRWSQPFLLSLLAVFVVAELLSALISAQHTFYHPYSGDPFMNTIGYTLLDLAAAALVLNLLSLQHPLARLFNLQPLRELGNISYGFYVFHDMLHGVYSRLARHLLHDHNFMSFTPLMMSIAFISTIVIATLSYRFFERPFLQLKSRFAD